MSAIKERPILFSGAMVRAILEGRKTVTRRVAKSVKHPDLGNIYTPGALVLESEPQHVIDRACPYGQPGDRLWVREAWQLHEKFTDNCVVVYKANERNSWTEFHQRFPVEVARGAQAKPFQTHGFRPSIHMPRWACRILLEITSVRVERLQDISGAQAKAEGYPPDREQQTGGSDLDAWLWFRTLWGEINGPEAFTKNPWVWVVEFKRIKQ